MGLHTEVEREFKFEARIGAPLPDLRPLVGRTVRHPRQVLHTAYFDSVDGRLWAEGLTLRHRITEGDDQGMWTLKTPIASGDVLERDELSWPGDRGEEPEEALRILRGVLRREPLRQLVELDTVRERLLLHDDGDAAVAELDDDLVTVSGGPRDGLRFRQVELELQVEERSARPLVECLVAAGLTGEPSSKLALAMPLSSTGSDATRLGRKSTLADVVRVRLREGFGRLVDGDWRLRLARPAFDPRDIHQARVATRRLRSDLKALAAVLDPTWVRHVRRDLKWLGSALGEVRDVDVLTKNLRDAPAEVRDALVRQRAVASESLALVLDDDRYLQLVDRLHAGSERVPIAGAGATELATERARQALPVVVGIRWRKVRRAVRKAGRHPSPEQLHRIRIKTKQLRYSAEFAAPVVGRPARRLAKAAQRVQDDLGEHHDAVSTITWLQTLASMDGGTRLRGGAAFEAGDLAAQARRRQARFESSWGRSWKKLHQPKRLRWLH